MSTPGFTQGDDFVAARVSIDVPTEGIQSLKEMSTGIANFKTSVEAAARSSSTFVGYIQQMTQAGNMATEAYRNLAAQLERNADLQQRAMGGVGGGNSAQALPLSRSAPQGYTDAFAGMGAGMGSGRAPMPNTADQVAQQQQQASSNPYRYVNAQAQRNQIRPGDIPVSDSGAPADIGATASRVEARDRIQAQQAGNTGGGGIAGTGVTDMGGGGGLFDKIANEMNVGGGSGLSAMNMGRQVAGHIGNMMRPNSQAAPNSSGPAQQGLPGLPSGSIMSGLGGGLLRMLGGPTGPVGLGLAGLGLMEKGGSIYQNYKNLGSIKGGGAAEGLETEVGIRTLALNPFISTEQARQVIMSGLSEGYKGKQFETVTQFMTTNLKDMNIQVGDSVQMLRKNVAEGGQSVLGLSSALGTLKEMSKTGYLSQQDLQRMYMQGTDQLISSGAGGPMASEAMLDALGGFKDNKALAGKWAEAVGSAGSNASSGAMLEAMSGYKVPGLPPQMLNSYMQANNINPNDIDGKALQGIVDKVFHGRKVKPGSTEFFKGVILFQNLYQRTFGASLDNEQASQMLTQLVNGHNPAVEGKQENQRITEEVNPAQGIMSDIGQDLGSGVGAVWGVVRGAFDLGHGDTGAAKRAIDEANKGLGLATYNRTAEALNPKVSSIVNQYGADQIEVGEDGNWTPLSGKRDQIEALAHGKANWRRKGDTGSGISLAQTGEDSDAAFRTGGSTNVSFSPAQVRITFDAQGRPSASPNPFPLTPNAAGQNAGTAGRRTNDTAPGY